MTETGDRDRKIGDGGSETEKSTAEEDLRDVLCCDVLCCDVLCCDVLCCDVLCCDVLCRDVLCCDECGDCFPLFAGLLLDLFPSLPCLVLERSLGACIRQHKYIIHHIIHITSHVIHHTHHI